MEVKDAHGGMREYSSEKVIRSCTRAGFSKGTAEEIERQVFKRAWDGITTKKLHSIIYDEMEAREESYALRYRLRDAIADLDPNYHEFEKYMTDVLRQDGIEATWSPRPMPQGECIEHEIDILAEVHDRTHVVECKHHYHHHRYTGLDVPMRQWARLEDLQKGHEQDRHNALDADRAWVIVNTKLSHHAKEYASCKGIRMTAWKYPEEDGLDQLIERNKAYPITILRPPKHAKVELSKRNILTIQKLLDLDGEEKEDLGLAEDTLSDLQRRARGLLE